MRSLFIAILVIACVPATLGYAQGAGNERPNVVLIITDDLGWADVGAYGSPDVRTPHIDSLARDGIRLTDFYANGTTCSPTRAGLLSGRYQQRFGLEGPLPTDPAIAGERGLRATGYSLPQLLKNHGYATGLIGKWHLGYKPEHSPNAHGFDDFFGFKSGFHDYYTHEDGDGKPDLWENERQVVRQGYTTDLITDRAIAFIEQHAREPFFIDIAYNAPHWPYQVPGTPSVAPDHARHVMPQDQTTSSRADYVAMVEHLDGSIGKVLAALERLGVAGNTIVVFTNDNGGEWLSSSEPLTGRKWTVWEGGIRVPAIVRWPGHIPPGTVSDQVGMTMDLTASILAITGAPVPDETRLEGTNLFPVWEGQAPELERTLFWRSKQPNRLQTAVRRGDWKVVNDAGHTYVFNLRTDPSERHDLANRRQDVAQTLWPLLKAWEQDVDAEAAANQPAPSTAAGPAAATASFAAAATAAAAAPDPLVFDTWVPGPCSPNGQPQGQCPPGELFRVRLVPIAEGLQSPRHIAFTPDGDLLITELAAPAGDPAAGNQAVQGRPGQVRRIHDGVLAPAPLAGWPTPSIDAGALWSIVVHPQFAANHFVYLYYVKKGADGMSTRALARARLDGTSLLDVQELFVADAWIPGGPMAGRAVFGPDGMIYLTVNDHVEHDGKNGGGEPLLAQQLDNDVGKVLRIRDDGGIPADNPFVGRTDAKPEIFTYGQRNVTDFAWHPTTGELWSTEVAPMGGDEINVLHAGHNYGWPLVALGKNYNQKELNENHWYRPGMDMPAMYWTPSISPSTLVWYTGDKLAPWKGHLFVGALNGQTLVRVAFDQPMPQAERRDSLFMSLGRRWRHVVQGPDGYLYALTEKRTLGGEPDPGDATSGVVYRLEPAG